MLFTAEKCPNCGKMTAYPGNIYPKDYDKDDTRPGFEIDGEIYGALIGMRCSECGAIPEKDYLIDSWREQLRADMELQRKADEKLEELNAMSRQEVIDAIVLLISDENYLSDDGVRDLLYQLEDDED